MYSNVTNTTIGCSTYKGIIHVCVQYKIILAKQLCNFTSEWKTDLLWRQQIAGFVRLHQTKYMHTCMHRRNNLMLTTKVWFGHLRLLPGHSRLVISKILDDKCDYGRLSRQIPCITRIHRSFCNGRQNMHFITTSSR